MWRGAVVMRAQGAWVKLAVLFAVIGAHRNERGSDDHRQENQSQDEIVNHGWNLLRAAGAVS